ncbi:MAG: Rne/Rng family ribonuclease [Acidimicrobiia bacterium]|nr:Rne/Rng family ribonuclease [Acidimicrobiia bacterium]
MTKELVISANRHETKVAIIEDEQLVEIYFQRANEYSLVGSIHKGRVTRVLPGMQSAFVELGLERDAFLYVSDFQEETGEDYERVGSGDRGRRQEGRAAGQAPPAAAPAGDAAPREGAQRGSDRGDRGGDRDRRGGRRSRRRRRGTRGFPDSKYASQENTGGTEQTPAAAAAAVEEDASAAEALVLPGESIAKYAGGEPPIEVSADNGNPEQEPEPLVANPAVEDTETAGEPEVAEVEPDDDEPEADTEEPESRVAEVEGMPSHEGLPALEPELLEEISEALAEDPREEAASAAEPSSNGDEAAPAVLEAGVREEKHARYINRGPRRLRRRGGRPERAERGERGERQESRGESPEGGRRDSQTVARPERERTPETSIADLLKEGQEIIVQIAKEPLGQKGARITSHIAMPGRYVVYMPTLDHLGVSRKIPSDEERQRLKRILQNQAAGMTGGFIVRTAGEGKSEADLGADMSYLYNQWLDIRKKAEKRNAPCLLHSDLELVTRTLRDQVNEQYKAIWVDNEEVYESILRFLERFQPSLVNRVKLYTRPMPIFDTFNITAELEKALRPKMWLKSGGYIVINQTEALVAIDINTGKYVGKSNRLEDTIVKTNIEAVKEIVRQVRLRDLGGIIVVDFIDMEERKNRHKVMQALEEAMQTDRAPYKILQFNDFGLVAITRRRVKQSLERALCMPCPTCESAGYVKSTQTVVGEILTEAHKIAPALEGKDVLLRVHPEVGKVLKAHDSGYLEELEEILGRPCLVKSDPQLHPEKFDLA